MVSSEELRPHSSLRKINTIFLLIESSIVSSVIQKKKFVNGLIKNSVL